MPSATVESTVHARLKYCTGKAEISAEVNWLHMFTVRTDDGTDRQPLDKLISRVNKLSLMGTNDDCKDDPKILLHLNPIAQENGPSSRCENFQMAYLNEEIISIFLKSISDVWNLSVEQWKYLK